MPDHVHMLLAIPPKYSVSSVMGYLKGKALEDGDKRLAASYVHLEEAERIARSGKLSDRESALLSPDIAFICLHAGGLEPSAATAGASSTSTGTSAPAAARTSWTAGTSTSSATSMFNARGASSKIGRRLSKDEGRRDPPRDGLRGRVQRA